MAIERQTAFWRRANSSGIPYSSRAPLSPAATLSRARPIPAANFEKLTVSRRPIYFNADRDYRCSIPLLYLLARSLIFTRPIFTTLQPSPLSGFFFLLFSLSLFFNRFSLRSFQRAPFFSSLNSCYRIFIGRLGFTTL